MQRDKRRDNTQDTAHIGVFNTTPLYVHVLINIVVKISIKMTVT